MKVQSNYVSFAFTGNERKEKYHKNPFLGTKTDEVVLKTKQPLKSPFIRKVATYITGLLTLAGVASCENSQPRVYDSEKLGDLSVNYFNVEKETRDSILTPLVTLKSKLTPENNFLNNLEIDITKSYEDLDDGNSFRKFLKSEGDVELDKGCSFYSDKNLKKRIVIQEGAHGASDKALYASVTGEYTALPSMRQSLMHEVGHQFDQFFGHDHNAPFAKKWDSIIAQKEKNPNMSAYDLEVLPKDKDARVEYFWNSAMSDKPKFQEAILKDFEHIARLKNENSSHLACNIEYYTDGVDFSKKITPEVVDLAESARTEVYANLFSYAMGQNDGDKTDFLDNFKHSYEVVKKDIKNKLHIDVELKALKHLK